MTNKEKLLNLVSKQPNNTLAKNRERIQNRAMLRESQNIALKVLMRLDELGWTQRELAIKMGVSPQQISKIVKGKENLTLETQVKLQEVLTIPILASFIETKVEKGIETILSVEIETEYDVVQPADMKYNDVFTFILKGSNKAYSNNFQLTA